MSYHALYLKYRPLRFNEVVGQDPIVKTLKNALANNKLSHAYLFSGPRGTGKTTMARLIAKAMNCQEGFGHECNKCDNCLEIISGIHPDVVEIDAASNNGVENIRNLIESIRYAPMKGDYKVYIIDEVHMMTPSAFNALLKTLEEPPNNVLFILATTEIHKVPQTILSRCQRFDFQRVQEKAIKERLKVVLAAENIQYDEKSVDLIASLADGGMRDALSILDQVVNYTNNVINVESIRELYSLVNQEEKISLIYGILHGETGLVLQKLNYLIDRGAKIQSFTEDLNEILKDLVVFNTLKDPNFLREVGVDDANALVALTTNEKLLLMMETLSQSESEYRNIHNIRNLFEITILKMININQSEPENKASQPTPKRVVPIPTPTPKPRVEVVVEKEIFEEAPIETPLVETKKTVVQEEPELKAVSQDLYTKLMTESFDSANQLKIETEDLIKVLANASKELKFSLNGRWENLIPFFTDPVFQDYARVLYDAKINVASSDLLIIEFDYDYLIKKINDKFNSERILELMQKAFGVPYRVYGLNRMQSASLIKLWRDMSQLGRIPKGNDIKYDLKEILKNAK